MTREELRDYVEEQRNLDIIPYHVYSTLIDGIDTLEQEPCEDKIIEWKKDFKEYVNSLSMLNDDYKGIMEYINDVPSTQPEILRCKECEHWDTSWQNDYALNYHYCPLVDGTRRDDFYCADAERKVNNPQESEGRTNK